MAREGGHEDEHGLGLTGTVDGCWFARAQEKAGVWGLEFTGPFLVSSTWRCVRTEAAASVLLI